MNALQKAERDLPDLMQRYCEEHGEASETDLLWVCRWRAGTLANDAKAIVALRDRILRQLLDKGLVQQALKRNSLGQKEICYSFT